MGKEKKHIMVPNTGKKQLKMFCEIGNKKHFALEKPEDTDTDVLEQDNNEGKGRAMSKSQAVIVETNAEQKVESILQRLNPTNQKAFIYLCNYAIQGGYIDEFEVDINEVFEILGLKRKTDTIKRAYEGLGTFTFLSFECETIIYKKGRKGERRGVKESLQSQAPLLTWVRLKKNGRKVQSLLVKMGDWFTHFKLARQNNDVELLTLPMECLKVDTKTFPYSFGSPYRMAQYARINEGKNPMEWHVLKLKEVIEGVEPWEEAEKKIRIYGFNHNKDRSFIDRFEQSMEHAETPFGLNWVWEAGKEPRTLAEAQKAKIKFRFLQPLKRIKDS